MVFTPIGDSLQARLTPSLQKGVLGAAAVQAAIESLSSVLGADLAKSAKPLYLKNRTLTIACGTSALAQAVRLNQAAIVEKVNLLLGKSEVDRIRYLI